MQFFLFFNFVIFTLIFFVFAQESQHKGNIIQQNVEKRQRATRQTTFNLFQWPRIDGPPNEFPRDDLFEIGYWTFNFTFIQQLLNLNKTDHLQAQILAFQASKEYQLSWRDECFKLSNKSAILMGHQNTLARVLAFPHQDKKTNLDKVFQLAPAIKLLCMERPKGVNINQPIINHSKTLLDLFGWDKETAERNIERIHQQLINKQAPNSTMASKPISKSNRKTKTISKSKKKYNQKSSKTWSSSPWQQSMSQPMSRPNAWPQSQPSFRPGSSSPSMPKPLPAPPQKYKTTPTNKW